MTTLVVLLFGCAQPQQPRGLEGYFENAPKIVKYGAVGHLRAGQTWQVFVAAEDPNGDMEAIIFDLDQPGGHPPYLGHVRRLKGEDTKAFSGYFYLNTPRRYREGLWGLTLTLKFKIRDRVGYTSEIVKLPLKFVGQKVEQPVPQDFTEAEIRPLGPILINIYVEDEGRGRPFF